MSEVEVSTIAVSSRRLNVADRLAKMAVQLPDQLAVVTARRGSAKYDTITFRQLDVDATQIALGLVAWGVEPGTRLALLVRPGIEFVTLVFALLRAGVVIVLVDPGLGRKNLVRCLADAEPEGFVAVPVAQAARLWFRKQFPQACWNVTVGRRWFWGGMTLDELRRQGAAATKAELPTTKADDAAAIIFTSGSTGPPKGVLYTQQMFDTQVTEIQSMYGIEPGGVDLSCFPLFALFNSAMGVTTVLPEMDFSRPASVDAQKLLDTANDWKVSQAFASPAVWRKLGEHCAKSGGRIPTLREVFSCGAAIPADVLRATLQIAAPGARMHTPYGATECLPVATIEASEVLGETSAGTDAGAGVCVGRKFDSIEWRVIRITDDPIAAMDDVDSLSAGEIGELVVRGPQASPSYVTRVECNANAKISSDSKRAGRSTAPHGGEDAPARFGESNANPWHRMGDVGYLDDAGRFWYCGRKSQRVVTGNGSLFTEQIEAVFNTLPGVRRAALVGVGVEEMNQPVMIIEPVDQSVLGHTKSAKQRQSDLLVVWYEIEPKLETLWYAEHGYTPLRGILFHRELPVDVRHNAKINRERLAEWAARQLPELA